MFPAFPTEWDMAVPVTSSRVAGGEPTPGLCLHSITPELPAELCVPVGSPMYCPLSSLFSLCEVLSWLVVLAQLCQPCSFLSELNGIFTTLNVWIFCTVPGI